MAGHKRKKPTRAPKAAPEDNEEHRRKSDRLLLGMVKERSLHDVTAVTAAPVSDSDEDIVDPELRRQAKALAQDGTINEDIGSPRPRRQTNAPAQDGTSDVGKKALKPRRRAKALGRVRAIDAEKRAARLRRRATRVRQAGDGAGDQDSDEAFERIIQADEQSSQPETIDTAYLTVHIACVFLPNRRRTQEHAYLLSHVVTFQAVRRSIHEHFYGDFKLARAAKNLNFAGISIYGPCKSSDRPTMEDDLPARKHGLIDTSRAYEKWWKTIMRSDDFTGDHQDFTSDDEVIFEVALTELADDKDGDLLWPVPDLLTVDENADSDWQMKYEAIKTIHDIHWEEFLALKADEFVRNGRTDAMYDGKEPWRKYLPEDLHDQKRIA